MCEHVEQHPPVNSLLLRHSFWNHFATTNFNGYRLKLKLQMMKSVI